MGQEEWMRRYGTTLANYEDFQRRHPNWHVDEDSWWFKSVGRSADTKPLWLSEGVSRSGTGCSVEEVGRQGVLGRGSGTALGARSRAGDRECTVPGHRPIRVPGTHAVPLP